MCPSIKRKKFFPTFLFTSSLMQTLVSTFLPIDKNFIFKHENMVDPNKRKVGIFITWVSHQKIKIDNKNKIIVFILPGLTGKSDDSYIQNLCKQVLQFDFQPVIYNYRLFSPKLELHQDEFINLTDDLKFTLEILQKQNPEHKIYAVGHSYGANQLVNYLGEVGNNSIVKGGVSVSNPYSMIACKSSIKPTFYDFALAKILAKALHPIRDVFDKIAHYRNFQVDQALSAKRVKEFDQNLIIHLFGFETTNQYYLNFGSAKNVKNVKIPLLGLSSRDDAITSVSAIPIDDYILNKNTILMLTNCGGHVGWVEGPFWNMQQWFVKPVMEYIKALVEIQKNQN